MCGGEVRVRVRVRVTARPSNCMIPAAEDLPTPPAMVPPADGVEGQTALIALADIIVGHPVGT